MGVHDEIHLSAPEAEALRHMGDDWKPGPGLPDRAIAGLRALQDKGLIEREFMDDQFTMTTTPADDDGFIVHAEMKFQATACWHFRLTAKGRAIQRCMPKFGGNP